MSMITFVWKQKSSQLESGFSVRRDTLQFRFWFEWMGLNHIVTTKSFTYKTAFQQQNVSMMRNE